MVLLLSALLACGPRFSHLEPRPMALSDGDTLRADAAGVQLGVLGGLGDGRALHDVAASGVSLSLLTGDAVPRSSASTWNGFARTWGRLPLVALPGGGERRGDPELAGFDALWPDRGVQHLEVEVPWTHFDVHAGSTRWRVVVVDAHADALGTLWQDQLYWLPKVASGEGWDHLLLVTNAPPHSLAEGWDGEHAASVRTLRELARAHAGTRLVAVLAGGVPTNELILPGGRWGEAWVVAGNAGRPAATLRRADARHQLDPGFARALVDEFHRWRDLGYEDPHALTQGADFDGDRWPVVGWWRVALREGELELALRTRTFRAGWHDTFTTRWTPEGGWGAAGASTRP